MAVWTALILKLRKQLSYCGLYYSIFVKLFAKVAALGKDPEPLKPQKYRRFLQIFTIRLELLFSLFSTTHLGNTKMSYYRGVVFSLI